MHHIIGRATLSRIVKTFLSDHLKIREKEEVYIHAQLDPLIINSDNNIRMVGVGTCLVPQRTFYFHCHLFTDSLLYIKANPNSVGMGGGLEQVQ
jgi:hypothetical protein